MPMLNEQYMAFLQVFYLYYIFSQLQQGSTLMVILLRLGGGKLFKNLVVWSGSSGLVDFQSTCLASQVSYQLNIEYWTVLHDNYNVPSWYYSYFIWRIIIVWEQKSLIWFHVFHTSLQKSKIQGATNTKWSLHWHKDMSRDQP